MIADQPAAPGTALRKVGDVTLDPATDPQTWREKLARIVLDGMYQFVGLLDAEGRTLEINRAALDGAGVKLSDIRGRPFWQTRWFAVSAESVAAAQDYVERARRGEFVRCDIEVYGRAAGEETIMVDFSLLPVRDSAGEVVFLLAEGRNITEKKKVEAEVARKNAELQSLLERVRQLDQLKADLFANVSHELRTPLALILGPADEMLASGTNLTEGQRQHLAVIRRNAMVLLRHVNDLLDLARLDAQKMVMSYSRVDLVALVQQAAGQFHALAPQRSLAYVVSTPDRLEAEIDPEKIERVLLNLLSNAFKFTPPGGRIQCRLERIGADRALIAVQDSGIGVAPEQRQAIFERFRQGRQGPATELGGTGLGLAIAKELVELHGGAIGVTSAAGGGALFQVELPLTAPPGTYVAAATPLSPGDRMDVLVQAELAEPPGQGAAEAEPAAPGADDRALLLVVEDNPEMRRFVREALAVEYRVIAVEDGQRALERAIAEPPDLVVTDLMLPRMGGDRLVDEMRRHALLSDVPVLVLSARQDEALRARLLAESVQDYVTKPFSAHELRARVHNLVTMKRARDVLRRELASHSKDLNELMGLLVANRQALQESEQRWWAIFENSPVGIALVDARGQIRTSNPAFRTMLGYRSDEMHGCTLQRITPVEDRAATEQRVARLAAGEVTEYHLQRRYQHRDGHLRWANTSVSLIPGAASDPGPLLVVVAEDITEQKHAEQALVRAQNELARVARVTTLGELAASIAHEVNQPLAAIVANGQACCRWLDCIPPNEHEARAAVQRIVRDANRAGEVITRIRSFLKRGELPRAPVAVGEVIADVLGLVRAEAQALRITLSHRVEPDLPEVIADRVQLQQVVLNLVMNAMESIQRTSSMPRAVEVAAVREGAQAVRIDVRDTGAGLGPGSAEHLFHAFQTTKPEGMGMGLAISRSIVEAHGGRIAASPNAGGGATFSFTLPVEPAP